MLFIIFLAYSRKIIKSKIIPEIFPDENPGSLFYICYSEMKQSKRVKEFFIHPSQFPR